MVCGMRGADQCFQALDNLVGRQPVAADVNGIFGSDQRSDLASRVTFVATVLIGQHLFQA